MPEKHLPQDPYIQAVTDALTAAGLPPTDHSWTDRCESLGTYRYLNAVITVDPSNTHDLDYDDVPADVEWPHGLLLLWEWHTGVEAVHGEPDRGPAWQFAELKRDGSNEYPTGLPVHGYASPDAIVDAARKVIAREIRPTSFDGGPSTWRGEVIGGSWERADELAAACDAWAVKETAER
ncbi:hypothetical protein ACFY78_36655 [Streptomyces olindensis]|uniref:hypothetical protein n=1 Tax=Streptomyces olindensis TaxID=358823 RepID=UPI003691FCFC